MCGETYWETRELVDLPPGNEGARHSVQVADGNILPAVLDTWLKNMRAEMYVVEHENMFDKLS